MKRFLVLVLTLVSVQFAYAADETANIKIKIAGAINDNTYFLCMPNTGCLSILAAKKGKVFQMLNPVEMNTLFVTDTKDNMRVYNQGLPKSCDVTVKPHQTITIAGTLSTKGNTVKVNNLHCSVS